MEKTIEQWNAASASCRQVFATKLRDYGASWRILRARSVTDQIFIKAQRIRSIEEKGEQRVGDDEVSEYKGIVNYSVIGLIQLELGAGAEEDMPGDRAAALYDKFSLEARSLMEMKNHDYGEAWRDMRLSSLTDIILMRILRIRQIEDNEGKTEESEGIDANYFDILNYAIFALIKLEETKTK
ncbi:MAG: DUF1599 domain-containing protein [Bacteroidota bacterium]